MQKIFKTHTNALMRPRAVFFGSFFASIPACLQRMLRRALEAMPFEKSKAPVRSKKLNREYLWNGLAIK
jgi:hypothetical protein